MHVETTVSRLYGEKYKKATVGFAFDGLFAVSGVRLVREGKHYRLKFPGTGNQNGEENRQEGFESAHPLCTEFRKKLTEDAVKAYHETAKNFPEKYWPEEWLEKKLQEN